MKRKEQKRRGGTIRKGEGSEWEERKDGKGGRTEKKRRGKRKGVKNGTKKRIERGRGRGREEEEEGGGGKRKQRDITEGTGTKYRNGMGSDEIRLDMIGGLDKIGGNEMG